MFLQSYRCTNGEIAFRRDAEIVASAADHAVVAGRKRDRVAEVERDEQRFERVISVRAPAGHMQEQVQLRGRGNDQPAHAFVAVI